MLVLQIEKVQQLRTETVRDNLLRYIDSLWKDSFDMFDMHIENLATEKLATALHGPVMLVTLGKVYKLQAKRAQGNMVAYFKYASTHNAACAKVELGCQLMVAGPAVRSSSVTVALFHKKRYLVQLRHKRELDHRKR
jgi:hypothetical protein